MSNYPLRSELGAYEGDIFSETMRSVLNVPPNTVMEYKNHDASLKDNSSFRNTHVRVE